MAALAVVTLANQACSSRTVYSSYQTLPAEGWSEDSVLLFDVPVTDTLTACQVVLSVCHTPDYPYQNIWFFVRRSLLPLDSATIAATPATADTADVMLAPAAEVMPVLTDTLEYFLADQRGHWLGNGFGEQKEMPCLVAEHLVFPRAGTYRIAVQHGMREARLRGVKAVGLSVERAE